MKIGYARVSTQEQSLDLQTDALKQAGCEKIFEEKVSGAKQSRPELDKMLEQLRKGDIIMVYKLDRLGRSIKHLLELVEIFKNKEVELVSISDNIDTSSIQGRLVFNIFASIAEFERDLIRERTMAGLQAAKKRGRIGGRPKGLSDKAQRLALVAEALYKENTLSVNEIAKNLGISKATLYKYLRFRGVQVGNPIIPS
jgi:DNA invertase Pin-like site-specific DNA recombinase